MNTTLDTFHSNDVNNNVFFFIEFCQNLLLLGEPSLRRKKILGFIYEHLLTSDALSEPGLVILKLMSISSLNREQIFIPGA